MVGYRGFFFYREELIKLERIGCGEVVWVRVAWWDGRLENVWFLRGGFKEGLYVGLGWGLVKV